MGIFAETCETLWPAEVVLAVFMLKRRGGFVDRDGHSADRVDSLLT